MNTKKVLSMLIVIFAMLHWASAQEKLSKEEWQQEIQKYTTMRDEAKTKADGLAKQITSLETIATKLDKDNADCMEALYALVGSSTASAEVYAQEIAAAENRANELLRLSDADVAAREGVVKDFDRTVKKLWTNSLSAIPDFTTRLLALNEQAKVLMGKLTSGERMFTVGTWSGDGACLWKIAGQVYDNPFMWPKIWVGNRDQISNPDIIQPGQQLKIPVSGELTREEKNAVKPYFQR